MSRPPKPTTQSDQLWGHTIRRWTSPKGILTSCNKAQQLVSCLTSTCDGQGKLNAYGVQQRKRKARLVCLRVQLEMITHDLSALKNGAKIKKFPLGGVTESEPANQKREQWCHRNENKAWWRHQWYIRACYHVFPHSLASSRGGNIYRKESMSHGVGRLTRYHIFT